jgi:hypothetical protein
MALNLRGCRKVELFRSLSREGVTMQYSSMVWTHIMHKCLLVIRVCGQTCLFILILSVVKVIAKAHFFLKNQLQESLLTVLD